jgi:hypothetical protein
LQHFAISPWDDGVPDCFGYGASGSNWVEPLKAPEHLCVSTYDQLIALLSLQRIDSAGRQCQHTCSDGTARRDAVGRIEFNYGNDTAIAVEIDEI